MHQSNVSAYSPHRTVAAHPTLYEKVLRGDGGALSQKRPPRVLTRASSPARLAAAADCGGNETEHQRRGGAACGGGKPAGQRP